ncbi:MAG: copper chaperone PCu(A)C, partial [Pseudohongiellaceae bacterium]
MLHETVQENGQLSMQHVMSAVVPAGGELTLVSGGLHLMIMGLKAPLPDNSNVELTLVFVGGLEKKLTLPVRSVLQENTAAVP